MKLTLAQIKSVTFGAVEVWEEDDRILFSRCTQKQVEAWTSLRSDLGANSQAGSGIRLDMHTDSSQVNILTCLPLPFEIWIDGIFYRCMGLESYDCADPTIRIPLGEGTHRLTVYFPGLTQQYSGIYHIEVDDGATVIPHTYDRKILFFGDSITQGVGASYTTLSYAQRVARALKADFLNQSVSGGFFAPRTFDKSIDFDPDIVTVAFGTNDWGFFSGPDRLELRSREFLDLLCEKYAGKKLFGISPLWRRTAPGETRGVGTFAECCEIVKNAIRSHGMVLIDGEELVPHQTLFFADGLHPNASGHTVYAESLLQKLQPHL